MNIGQTQTQTLWFIFVGGQAKLIMDHGDLEDALEESALNGQQFLYVYTMD